MEQATETAQTEAPAKPKNKGGRPRKIVKAAPPSPPTEPIPAEFAGLTAEHCPNACTPQRCIISTVEICKHPCKSALSGCGPITLANRERAMKVIKQQALDKE